MNNNFLFNTICDDVIGMIIEEKKIIDETKKNKEKFNDTIKNIKEQGEDLIVGHFWDDAGEKCPCFLWEFNCCEADDDTDEEDRLLIDAIHQQYDNLGIHILY